MKRRRVTLLATGIALALAGPVAFGQDFVVNSTADAVNMEADGQCNATVDSQTVCTLREAVMEANANTDASNTITFDATVINAQNPINLTLTGSSEEGYTGSGTQEDPYVAQDEANAQQGDLDIVKNLTITGVDPNRPDATLIQWNAPEGEQPDRIFQVHGSTTGVSVTLRYLTLRGGSVSATQLAPVPEKSDTYWYMLRNGGAIANGACCNFAQVDLSPPSEEEGPPADIGPGGDSGGSEGGDEGGPVIDGLTLERVVVLNNHADGSGGGIYSGAPLVLKQSVISGNSAGTETLPGNGGGLYNDAELTMTEATVGSISNVPLPDLDPTVLAVGNAAEGGGGIFDTGSHTSHIERSAIVGNYATGGGGIAARSGVTVDISNSTIAGNQAGDVGGGVTTNGTVNLTNVTVVDNKAPGETGSAGGGGLNAFGGGNFHLVNTLLAGNLRTGETSDTPANCGATGGSVQLGNYFLSSGNNMEDADTCAFTLASDHVNSDAKLGPLSNNDGLTETVALMEGSPAIDAGSNAAVVGTTDQRGHPRITDGNGDGVATVDIGAFETNAAAVVPPSDVTDGTSGGGGGGGGCTVNTHGADPTLPALLAAALGFLGWRRNRRQQ